MTPERWQEVTEILNQALKLWPEQRANFLSEISVRDPELHQEVVSLLAHENADPEFLNTPAMQFVPGLVPGVDELKPLSPMLGRRLGAYEIVELIGLGGMGEVYRAFRADDQYRKQVALKVMRGGHDSGFVISRFRNERQILATLDHPNIARLLDGGTTAEGVPYFVMELIDGKSIDQYCDHHQLVTNDRLRLFLQVCSAVQFAHQRLIIHRDIKPGNILVTADGAPKLLDFGIAKILDTESASGQFEPTLTLFRQLTPGYASPEQIKGEPITTATDVYSLGVVLYELLAGRHPYRAAGVTAEQMARAVCEVEPRKPSSVVQEKETQLATGATPLFRSEDPAKLGKRLRGDLDNIVLMALRKEPQRRYSSVEQFAGDIRRYLDKLPVSARKDTAGYRASKFIDRHKAAVAATVLVVVTLVTALMITLREAHIARLERTRAEARFNDLRAVANSLIFDVHDSIKDLPGSTPARKVIVDRALRYLNSLAQESGGDVGLQRELATAYERVGLVQGHYTRDNLGDTKGSLDSYQKALAIRKQVDSKSRDWRDRLALAQVYRFVGDLQRAMGNPDEARDNFNHAIAASEGLENARPNDPQVLLEMAFDYRAIGSREAQHKALAADETALRIQPDDLPTLDAYATDLHFAGDALEQTDPHAALPYYRREVELSQRVIQKSSGVQYARRLALAYHDMSSVYEDFGDYRRALESTIKYLNIIEELNRDDPQNATLRQSLAIAYTNAALDNSKAGNVKLALELSGKAVEIMRKLVSSAPENVGQHHYLAAIVEGRGTVFMIAHQPTPALKQFEEARALYQSLGSSYSVAFDNASAAACSEKMGEAAVLSGQTQEAGDYFRQALTEVEPMISGGPPNLVALYAASDAYSGLGDLSFKKAQKSGQAATARKASLTEARRWYEKSLETWRHIEHPMHAIPGTALDVGDPARVSKKLQQCNTALAATRSLP